jgi:hypothetical protein
MGQTDFGDPSIKEMWGAIPFLDEHRRERRNTARLVSERRTDLE